MHITSDYHNTSPRNQNSDQSVRKETQRTNGNNSNFSLPLRHRSGASTQAIPPSHNYALRNRNTLRPNNGETLQDTYLNTAGQTPGDIQNVARHHSVDRKNAETCSIQRTRSYNTYQRPQPEYEYKTSLSEGVAQCYLDVPDIHRNSHVDTRADSEGKRRSPKPVSKYQADLDAVSPEFRSLFLQSFPSRSGDLAAEDEDEDEDKYWTWSQDKEQWFHVEEDGNTIVWFPREFD
ncbi:hypothetical protein AAE478_007839 [Parahypoxylon ruwenzoriense]